MWNFSDRSCFASLCLTPRPLLGLPLYLEHVELVFIDQHLHLLENVENLLVCHLRLTRPSYMYTHVYQSTCPVSYRIEATPNKRKY